MQKGAKVILLEIIMFIQPYLVKPKFWKAQFQYFGHSAEVILVVKSSNFIICFTKQISIFSEIAVWNQTSTRHLRNWLVLTPTPRNADWPWRFLIFFSVRFFSPHDTSKNHFFLKNYIRDFYNLNTKCSHTNSFSLLDLCTQLKKKKTEKQSPEWFIRGERKLQCM